MKAAGTGSIINISSRSGLVGIPGAAAYASSKAGVAGLTLTCARDLADKGIRVMCIAPGVFETPMMAGMPDGVKESLEALVPHPARLGKPAEYAALVAHHHQLVPARRAEARVERHLRAAVWAVHGRHPTGGARPGSGVLGPRAAPAAGSCRLSRWR